MTSSNQTGKSALRAILSGVETSEDEAALDRNADDATRMFISELRLIQKMIRDLRNEPITHTSFRIDEFLKRLPIGLVAVAAEKPTGSGATAATRRLKHGDQLGDYTLELEIGRGGSATVYRAVHSVLGRLVAIKVLDRVDDPNRLARFHREMKAIGALEHPNFVNATDAGRIDDIHFLVMQFVKGTDTARLLRRHGSLSIELACDIVRQVAKGMGFAHQRQLIHRDLKPANLLLGDDNCVRILDLGLALLKETDESESLTSVSNLMGSIDYIAPEQIENARNADARTDIYALGCTMFHFLAGRPLFCGDEYVSDVSRVMAQISVVPVRVQSIRPAVPKEVDDLVAAMLAKAPDDRPQSMEEVERFLTF